MQLQNEDTQVSNESPLSLQWISSLRILDVGRKKPLNFAARKWSAAAAADAAVAPGTKPWRMFQQRLGEVRALCVQYVQQKKTIRLQLWDALSLCPSKMCAYKMQMHLPFI